MVAVKFIGKIWVQNKTLVITIPRNIIRAIGGKDILKAGDLAEVYIETRDANGE